jgi:CRISPR-associated endonuclease/helicase Cas3
MNTGCLDIILEGYQMETETKKEYYAHTPAKNSDEWHLLADHLQETARLAGEFAGEFNAKELSYVAGLLHDLGKAHPDFQNYLLECYKASINGSKPPYKKINHKNAGALYVSKLNPILQLLSPVILGHHSGMPNLSECKNITSEYSGELICTPDVNYNNINNYLTSIATDEFSAELLIRLLFSTLVDADSLDTEKHFDKSVSKKRKTKINIEGLHNEFFNYYKNFIKTITKSSLNTLRNDIFNSCVKVAALEPGVFSLTVPTGGGKTLSSLAFALEHAKIHNLSRIIFAIPFTSIIEQTADVFRSIFENKQAVLEHHSGSYDDENSGMWQKLASENWDASLIITTTVQLFDSLFSNRPGACRKNHRLANSVIILDEVQKLPEHLLAPILNALSILVKSYNSTLLLCTATQPTISGDSPIIKGLPKAHEIVEDPKELFSQLKRVNYQIHKDKMDWHQISDLMRDNEQCLTIVNSKKDAILLLDALDEPDAMHLSTRLCGAHRRVVLQDLKDRLKNGEPCKLISTQVIEAGVDIDFPVVIRAIGPLDSIVQAAGRCNREGKIDTGEVHIVFPADGHSPKSYYETAMTIATNMLQYQNSDLHDPNLFIKYFNQLYSSIKTDKYNIQGMRKALQFRDIAEKFHVINDDTVPVLTNYNQDEYNSILDAILYKKTVNRDDWRSLQPYLVSLYRHDFRQKEKAGLVEEIISGSGLYRWLGGYDNIRGLQDTADPTDLII